MWLEERCGSELSPRELRDDDARSLFFALLRTY
jgi:hypothetical protein